MSVGGRDLLNSSTSVGCFSLAVGAILLDGELLMDSDVFYTLAQNILARSIFLEGYVIHIWVGGYISLIYLR